MGAKDKKRKAGKTPAPTGMSVAPVAEDKVVAPEATVRSAPVAATEAPKPKTTKPAPVLTKKPSRLRFFADAYLELRKAHWPSRREAVRLSLLVAAVCLVVGVVLGILDLGFGWLMRLALLRS